MRVTINAGIQKSGKDWVGADVRRLDQVLTVESSNAGLPKSGKDRAGDDVRRQDQVLRIVYINL